NLQNRVEIGRESKQMNRKNGARFFRDRLFDHIGRDVECVRKNVHKDRLRSCASDGSRSRDERKGGRNDFVARTDPARAQRQVERVRTRCAADRKWRFHISSCFLFKQFYLLPKNKLLTFQNRLNGLQNFAAYRRELCLEVEESQGGL